MSGVSVSAANGRRGGGGRDERRGAAGAPAHGGASQARTPTVSPSRERGETSSSGASSSTASGVRSGSARGADEAPFDDDDDGGASSAPTAGSSNFHIGCDFGSPEADAKYKELERKAAAARAAGVGDFELAPVSSRKSSCVRNFAAYCMRVRGVNIASAKNAVVEKCFEEYAAHYIVTLTEFNHGVNPSVEALNNLRSNTRSGLIWLVGRDVPASVFCSSKVKAMTDQLRQEARATGKRPRSAINSFGLAEVHRMGVVGLARAANAVGNEILVVLCYLAAIFACIAAGARSVDPTYARFGDLVIQAAGVPFGYALIWMRFGQKNGVYATTPDPLPLLPRLTDIFTCSAFWVCLWVVASHNLRVAAAAKAQRPIEETRLFPRILRQRNAGVIFDWFADGGASLNLTPFFRSLAIEAGMTNLAKSLTAHSAHSLLLNFSFEVTGSLESALITIGWKSDAGRKYLKNATSTTQHRLAASASVAGLPPPVPAGGASYGQIPYAQAPRVLLEENRSVFGLCNALVEAAIGSSALSAQSAGSGFVGLVRAVVAAAGSPPARTTADACAEAVAAVQEAAARTRSPTARAALISVAQTLKQSVNAAVAADVIAGCEPVSQMPSLSMQEDHGPLAKVRRVTSGDLEIGKDVRRVEVPPMFLSTLLVRDVLSFWNYGGSLVKGGHHYPPARDYGSHCSQWQRDRSTGRFYIAQLKRVVNMVEHIRGTLSVDAEVDPLTVSFAAVLLLLRALRNACPTEPGAPRPGKSVSVAHFLRVMGKAKLNIDFSAKRRARALVTAARILASEGESRRKAQANADADHARLDASFREKLAEAAATARAKEAADEQLQQETLAAVRAAHASPSSGGLRELAPVPPKVAALPSAGIGSASVPSRNTCFSGGHGNGTRSKVSSTSLFPAPCSCGGGGGSGSGGSGGGGGGGGFAISVRGSSLRPPPAASHRGTVTGALEIWINGVCVSEAEELSPDELEQLASSSAIYERTWTPLGERTLRYALSLYPAKETTGPPPKGVTSNWIRIMTDTRFGNMFKGASEDQLQQKYKNLRKIELDKMKKMLQRGASAMDEDEDE